MAEPLWGYSREERAKLAASHLGKQVTLAINPTRRRNDDTALVFLVGTLLCVASSGVRFNIRGAGRYASRTLSTADIVVVLTDQGNVQWYPLAIVENIAEQR